MMLLCGVVTGLKKGNKNDKGKIFHTLKVEVGNRTYYPMFEAEKLFPQRDQEITLLCDVKARNGFLNLFVVGHVADSMLVDPANYDNRSSSFDDFAYVDTSRAVNS